MNLKNRLPSDVRGLAPLVTSSKMIVLYNYALLEIHQIPTILTNRRKEKTKYNNRKILTVILKKYLQRESNPHSYY